MINIETNKESGEIKEEIIEQPRPKKGGRPKKSFYIKKVEQDLKELKEIVFKMRKDLDVDRVFNLEDKKGDENKEPIIGEVDETRNHYPVPADYRKAVDLILNQDFGVKIEPCSDSPEFNFIIIVPDKYSPLSVEEKTMAKADLRSKNISYSEKTNGVRQWAEKVFDSFNQEVKAQIVNDRRLSH